MARTTGVSNPVRSPGFRASASVAGQEVAFAIGVLPDIYAFHCYTGNSTSLSRTLSPTVSVALLRLSRRFSRPTCGTAYTPFTPSKSGQRLPPLSYRGCWHRVSRGLFWGYRHLLPPKKQFTTRKPSSCTRRCSIRLAPIVENSLLLPPVGVWAVSQSQSGWLSSQTSYPSKAWWAITPPTTVMGRKPLFQRI